jgi:hypothetical protein
MLQWCIRMGRLLSYHRRLKTVSTLGTIVKIIVDVI